MKIAALGVALVAFAACESLTNANADSGFSLELSTRSVVLTDTVADGDTIIFTGIPLDENWEEILRTMAVVENGSVHVQGIFGVTCSDGLVGSIERTPEGALLRIDAPRREGVCPQEVGLVRYDGYLTNIAPGSYLVRVEHSRDVARSPDDGIVLERQVEVP